jgi:putative transposase
VCIAVCDGLKGLPDAAATVWPKTVVQTCIVHLLRNSFKYASRKDWSAIARDLKPVYTAATEQAALDRFAEFAATWEAKYPAIIRLWTTAWAEMVPFLAFDTEIRSIICTTNAIVIWSSPVAAFHVQHGGGRSSDLRAGRGYLPRSMRQIFRRNDACSAGRLARPPSCGPNSTPAKPGCSCGNPHRPDVARRIHSLARRATRP